MREGMACSTLPVLLESVVLDERKCFAYYYIGQCHKHAALCERHCKITKKVINQQYGMAKT